MNLPNTFIQPDWQGGSIANIPATVAAILNVPFTGMKPLRPALWQPLADGAKRVVLLILDAFGWNLFQQERPFIENLLGETAVTAPITSIFPSTTTAALTTIWTGATPGQHGLVGLRFFLSDYAVLSHMIKFNAVFDPQQEAHTLTRAGLDPKTFLPVPGVAQQLATASIPTHVFKGRELKDTALSQMHGRGVVKDHGIITFADLCTQLAHFLDQQAYEPLYTVAYWPTLDTLSHVYNWHHPSVKAELQALLRQIKHNFLDQLSSRARAGTRFFITADHGQIATSPEKQIHLADHPRLRDMLFMEPGGDPRTVYLYGRHGSEEAIVAYLAEHLAGQLTAIKTAEAIEAGLFGPPPLAATAANRIGDVVLIAHEDYTFLTSLDTEKTAAIRGWHGGLTAAEMQVPWLGFELG